MARQSASRQPAFVSAAGETLDESIETLSAMPIHELQERWRQTKGRDVPAALTRDLLARWLIHELQEHYLGGLAPRYRRLLAKSEKSGEEPDRHVKTGSVIVREYQGVVHEVLVVPDGFCWQGKVYSSLSTIARKITGTSWNGPRFFGLRGAMPKGSGHGAEPTLDKVARNESVAPASSRGRISGAPTAYPRAKE